MTLFFDAVNFTIYLGEVPINISHNPPLQPLAYHKSDKYLTKGACCITCNHRTLLIHLGVLEEFYVVYLVCSMHATGTTDVVGLVSITSNFTLKSLFQMSSSTLRE